jgi:hypothetical protein
MPKPSSAEITAPLMKWLWPPGQQNDQRDARTWPAVRGRPAAKPKSPFGDRSMISSAPH